MDMRWHEGHLPGLGETPCLVSWRNGMALVVPLRPLAPNNEMAPFSMPGWYDKGSARDVEMACATVAEYAVTMCSVQASAFRHGVNAAIPLS